MFHDQLRYLLVLEDALQRLKAVNEPPTVEEKEMEKNILELLLAYVRPEISFSFVLRFDFCAFFPSLLMCVTVVDSRARYAVRVAVPGQQSAWSAAAKYRLIYFCGGTAGKAGRFYLFRARCT